MTEKNKIYLLATISYLLAGVGGFLINTNFYWIILLFNLIITAIILIKVLNKENKEKLYRPMMFEWISVVAFSGLELLLIILIDIAKLPFSGFVGYMNLTVQILGYILVGYSIVRFTFEHTDFYKDTKWYKKITCKEEKNKNDKETSNLKDTESNELEKKQEEIIEESISNDVPIVGKKENDEIIDDSQIKEEVKEIELKKEEEKENKTPYMEEER